MKTRFALLVIAGTFIALGLGWFFDNQKVISTQNSLEVPDNIDYYLSSVNFLAYNEQGVTRFRLQTPYLEHHIREDTSQLTQPTLDYHVDSEQWELSANRGSYQHQPEIFELREQARISRLNANPFILNSELFILDTQTEHLTIPQDLRINSPTLKLSAQSAILDLKTSRYQFNRVMATYENRNQHEPG